VPANVVKAPHLSVFAAHGNGAFSGNIERYIVAGLRNVSDMAEKLPATPEEMFLFQLHRLVIEISPARQSRALTVFEPGLNKFVGLRQDAHGAPVLIERSFNILYRQAALCQARRHQPRPLKTGQNRQRL
jgi:hypothetical protein